MDKKFGVATDRVLVALVSITLALVCAAGGAAVALTMTTTSRATPAAPVPPTAKPVAAPVIAPAAPTRTTSPTATPTTSPDVDPDRTEDDEVPSCGEIDPADYVDSNSCINGNPDPATGTATGEDLAREAIDADVPGDDIDPQRAYDLGDRPLTDAEVAKSGG